MKKNYIELEINILQLFHEDILTESSENDVIDDPYNNGNNWWENNN
jgi:hypothetical protein